MRRFLPIALLVLALSQPIAAGAQSPPSVPFDGGGWTIMVPSDFKPNPTPCSGAGCPPGDAFAASMGMSDKCFAGVTGARGAVKGAALDDLVKKANSAGGGLPPTATTSAATVDGQPASRTDIPATATPDGGVAAGQQYVWIENGESWVVFFVAVCKASPDATAYVDSFTNAMWPTFKITGPAQAAAAGSAPTAGSPTPAAAPANKKPTFGCVPTANHKASDSYDSQPKDAFDCAATKLWNANDYSGWVQADFASPQTFSGVTFSGCVSSDSTITYTVSGSNDGGATWTVIDKSTFPITKASNPCDVPSNVYTTAFDPPVTYGSLKVEGKADSSWLALGKIQIAQ